MMFHSATIPMSRRRGQKQYLIFILLNTAGCPSVFYTAVQEEGESWPSFRGRAIEPVVRDSLERLLPDAERFGAARYAGGYWNRTGAIEVDLVGGDAWPVAKRVAFVGSIKWRQRRHFSRADALALAASRAQVPGASEETLLLGVSSRGFEANVPLDVQVAPTDLIAAWRGC